MDCMDARDSVYGMEGLKCRRCGARADLDDIDYNFRGNQDEVWVCEHCRVMLCVKVRYGKVISVREIETD